MAYALRQAAPDLHIELIPCLEAPEAATAHVLLYSFLHRGCDAAAVERALTRLRDVCPTTSLVVLTDMPAEDIASALQRLHITHCSSVASGFAALIAAIRVAVAEAYSKPLDTLQPINVDTVALPTLRPAKSDGIKLTVKEKAILGLVRQGKCNKVIAFELTCSESTIKVHISNMMRKLRLQNRTQLALLPYDLNGSSRPVAAAAFT